MNLVDFEKKNLEITLRQLLDTILKEVKKVQH